MKFHHNSPHLRRIAENRAAAERQREITPICGFRGVPCIYWAANKEHSKVICKHPLIRSLELGIGELETCPADKQKPLFKEPV